MNWLRWSLGMLLWVLALAILLAELPSAIALFVIGADARAVEQVRRPGHRARL